MPDSQHVLSFLGGFGQSLVSGLKEQAAQREQDKASADQEKKAQEAWLHQTLLKSLSDPSTTIEDHNAVLRYLFENVGPKAGVKPDDLHNLMQHVMMQVGTVSEPGPEAKPTDMVALQAESPDELTAETRPRTVMQTRPLTVGDVQARQLAQRTRLNAEALEPTKEALERQKGLQRSDYLTRKTTADKEKILLRGDVTADKARRSRELSNIAKGMTPDEAASEAANYASSLSDLTLQAKQQGIELNASRVEKIKADIANIAVKNAQADQRIAIAQANAATAARNATTNEERTRLTGVGQQLAALKNRRDKAVSLMEQAGRVVANPFALEHERQNWNFEWENRRGEIEQIDQQIESLTSGLSSLTGKGVTKSTADPRIGKVMADKTGKRWLIKSIGPDGQPIGVPAP
jgi:hypothetical protein